MAVIDTYFEWVLSLRGSTVIMLPGGVSAEKYLERLDLLIKEQFSRITMYDEIDYRSGKAGLLLLKKYCFSKKTYGNAPQSADFSTYADATVKMIDDELQRIGSVHNGIIPIVHPETMFTITANTLQLMTSVVKHYNRKKEDNITKTKAKVAGVELPIMVDVQKEIVWEREDTKLVNVIPYLDNTFSITESFNKSRKNQNAPVRVIAEWAEFRYLSMLLEISKIKLEELEVF